MPASTSPLPVPRSRLNVPRSLVVDVSEHNAPIDWARMAAAGVSHAYIRCTRGARHVDAAFLYNIFMAPKQGIGVGLYHYFAHHIDGRLQAEWFLHVCAGTPADLPPALDVEGAFQVTTPAAAELHAWLALVEERLGVRPVVYTSAGYWNPATFGRPVPWAADYPLWVAHWTNAAEPLLPADWPDYWLWQYGHADGRRFGVHSTLIDVNQFNERLPLATCHLRPAP